MGRVQRSTAAASAKEAAFLGHEINAQNVSGAARHAQDQSTEGFAINLFAHAGDGAKGCQCFRGLRRQPFVPAGLAARRAQFR
jgi:hypothetical protein